MADFEDSSHQPMKPDPVDDYLLETAGFWLLGLLAASAAVAGLILWAVFR